jgi:hypothetical protein
VLFIALFAACDSIGTTQGHTPEWSIDFADSHTPKITIIEQDPLKGQRILLDASIELVFNQEMDQEKTTDAWSFISSDGKNIPGKVSWPDEKTFTFTPNTRLENSSLYVGSFSTKAASLSGESLSEEITLEFTTVGKLRVDQVFPAEGTQDVEIYSSITVVFNRPVVPLLIAEEKKNLPDPIEITPSVSGTGEWLNSAVYVFQPDELLIGGQDYTVNVPSGLEDTTGNKLEDDFEWKFTIRVPGIESFGVKDGDKNPTKEIKNLLLDQAFIIRFLQPMITQSVEDALTIIDRETQKEVPLNFEWDEDQKEITIQPVNLLKVSSYYTLTLFEGVEAQFGGTVKKEVSLRFSTVPLPGVKSVSPKDGTIQEDFSSRFIMAFNSPMDLESLKASLTISPQPEEVSYYFNNRYWELIVSGLEPSTDYVIRLNSGAHDIYGNRLSSSFSFSIKTAALDPSAYLVMSSEPMMYRVGGEQEFFVRYRNIDGCEFSLYKLSDDDFSLYIRGNKSPRNFSGDSENLVREWQLLNLYSENSNALEKQTLITYDGEDLPPGYYFLGLNAPPAKQKYKFLSARLFFVANANISLKTTKSEALVWLTDLETGKPLSGVPIGVFDKNNNVLVQGNTDADGVIYFEDIKNIAYAKTLDSNVVAYTSERWGSGVSPGEFGVWMDYYREENKPVVYVYTDRPIYRPGQEVSFKGILRYDDDLDYSLPDNKFVFVNIENRGGTIYSEQLYLNKYGSFSGQFELAEDASLGNYRLEVILRKLQDPITSLDFSVGEYRKPEFFFDLTASDSNVLAGDEFTILLDADYYSGGNVGNAEIEWTVQAAPYNFIPDREYQRFSFRDRDQDSGYEREKSAYTNTLAKETAATDDQGHFEMDYSAELANSSISQYLEFLANVTDIGGNVVGDRIQIAVHHSAIYPGVRAKNYIGKVGEEQPFEIVVLDWESTPVPGKVVDVEIAERRWYSVQEKDEYGNYSWVSSVENIPVTKFRNITVDENGMAKVTFIPKKGGVYKAIVSSHDEFGNRSVSSAFMWVTGSTYVSWRQTNDRSISVILDKDEYSPGETAEILIASPFQQETYALVTIERGHIQDQEVILLENNSYIYKLPITAEMAPIVYFSVVVVKGSQVDSSPPDFRLGMTSINVDTSHQVLNVDIDTDKESAGPGDEVTYTVTVTNYNDQPVEAEVSLALLDLSSLALVSPNSPSLLSKFYPLRGLSVRSSLAIPLNAEDYNFLLEETTPDGGNAGGGGGRGFGVVDIREEFPDTAYWEGHVVTDENGEASVTITLPDNLTTWQLDARAVTKDTEVGQATHDLVSVKPLFVRPYTPRFFVTGDQSRVAALVHNTTKEALSVNVSLEANGIDLISPVDQVVEVGPEMQEYVYWDFTVSADVYRVDLLFSVFGGSYSDSSRPTLGVLDNQGIPVFSYYAPHTVGTSGMLSDSDTIVESISLPSIIETGDGILSVEISTSLTANLLDGLTYLRDYPHSCMEQTVSRFLPNVFSARALSEAGIFSSELKSQLDYQVGLALARIYANQNSDGGWGWWRNDSDTLVSAYVVLGLIEAKQAGYDISESTLERGVKYLKTNVQKNEETVKYGMQGTAKLNRQAFIYYVLSRTARYNSYNFYVSNLYDNRDSLSLYAVAFLTQTLYTIDPEDARIGTLISELSSAAISSAEGAYWEETLLDYWNWNTDIRTTAIVINVLAQIDPENYMIERGIRWLMHHRDSGHWQSTQETTWVLMALTNWMNISGELDPDYPYGVGLNGESLLKDTATKDTVDAPARLSIDIEDMIQDDINALVIGRGEGPGNLYYSSYLKVTLSVEQIQPLDQGIIVSRSYYRLDDFETPVTEVGQGELVRVRVTIVAPHTLHYVVINDFLPAGLEIIDRSLETSLEIPTSYSRQDFLDRGWGWWYFDHIDYHDEKVVVSADYLPSGTYVFTYLARASTPGEYKVIPVVAEQFYFPDVSGRSAGSTFVVSP